MEYLTHRYTRFFLHVISAPLIYMLIVPIVFLDMLIEIYHRICFPIYGIPYIPRSRYIAIDRYKLSYLNLLEKFNCLYCGYANGVFFYVSMIAAATEAYWCGIQHEKKSTRYMQRHQKDFLQYGDEVSFHSLKES